MHHYALRRAANQGGEINGDKQVTYLIIKYQLHKRLYNNCQFCSFYRPPGHEETYTQTLDEISQRVTELEAIDG